jgi:putative DNA primase/helicase
MTLIYSRGRNKRDNKPEQRECTDFDAFEKTVLSDVSETKGKAYICSPLQAGLHYQKPKEYPGVSTWRLKDYVLPRQFLAFDFDGFSDPEAFEQVKRHISGRYRGFVYTTFSHTREAPRARAILLASRPMARDECEEVSFQLQSELEAAVAPRTIKFDKSVYRGEQPIYTPVRGAETFPFAGKAIDVDALLKNVQVVNDPVAQSRALLGNSTLTTDLLRGLPGGLPADNENEHNKVKSALSFIDPDCGRDDWLSILMALQWTAWECAEQIAKDWSRGAYADKTASKFTEEGFDKTWVSLVGRKVRKPTTLGTLFHMAQVNGWVNPARLVQEPRVDTATDSDAWPEPKSIAPSLHPVPPFDMSMLPKVFKPYVADASELMDVPPDLIAIPMMVVASAVLGNTWRIAPKQKDLSWMVTPVIWGAIVSPPGSKKSPCLRKALSPLERIERDLAYEYTQKLGDYQLATFTHEESVKAAKKNPSSVTQAALVPPVKPEPERLMTNDATYQKLADMHHWSPRGIAVIQDELVGVLEGMETKGQEASRAFFLGAWNGDQPHRVDRVGRPSNLIERLALYVLGGMQPDKLRVYVSDAVHGGGRNDGLIQRFQLLVQPDMPDTSNYVDRPHDFEAAENAVNAIVKLRHIKPEDVGAKLSSDGSYAFLQFSPDAQASFVKVYTSLGSQARDSRTPSYLRSHLEKYPRLVAALALIIHLLDEGEGPVSITALNKAAKWMCYLKKHAKRIYGIAGGAGSVGARNLAERLSKGELSSPFVKRDVERKCWSGLSTSTNIDAALDCLVTTNWLKKELPDNGAGSQTGLYYINPTVVQKSDGARG